MVKLSFKTLRADWGFIISTTLVFVFSLIVTAWDFVVLQGMVFSFGVVNAVGLVLFVIGTVLRQVRKRTLGKYYSYGLRVLQEHKLAKHGVYRYVRHPITLAALIYSPGIPLFFASFYGFAVMLGMIPLFVYRMEIEERMLIEEFGDEYREYMKKTKKLIPFLY
jgi:protein-S-isoprenylcysteine O-methyltransferase Ste14